MGKYVVETPFLKVSPRAYYPDYTVIAFKWMISRVQVQSIEFLNDDKW